ncbi:nicotinate (nicotinamide) nucleotide adenylyltransferase [Limibacterium fermenti]|uniref:nicotinate (nicotinamide) nucleotide adenylyltransferase n=1 Tax=Limibacterium fermenti TaxID=3229863 RepID=UPI003A646933
MQKKQIGIFPGSFNPIHCGHLILANYMCEFTCLDEVWFVVSPHNPLKEAQGLLDDELRLQMAERALEKFDKLKVSDIEFSMPRPSYTIDTLRLLSSENPDKEFVLILGGDNWRLFEQWKEYIRLRQEFKILIYPRLGEEVTIPPELAATISYVKAPIVEISSTFIRNSLKDGKDVRAFLPPAVYDMIQKNGYYCNR